MEHIQPYLDYFSAHPGWALAIIFLIALGEALLIIGLFVPSTAVLVGAGILVGSGHLGFWPVFAATALGCIMGDQLSYWAGRLFGERLKSFWPLSKYPTLVARGETFVREHGGKSIAIGRFVPGVKAVVPGVVGMLGMSQPFFIFVNVTSGIVWSLAHLLPGVLIGKGLSVAGEFSGRLVMVLIVLLVVLGVLGWLIRLFAASVQPYLNHVLQRISIAARRSNSRAMHRFGKAIAPGNPRAAWLVLFFVVIAGGVLALFDMVSGLVLRNAASNLDVSVANLMNELRNAPADSLFIPFTMLAERPVVWALGLAMAAWLFLWRSWRVSLLLLAIMAFAEFASININGMMGTAAPMAQGGFPSTPTLMAGLAFGLLSVLAGHSMGRWSKAVVAGFCGCVVVVIAFSRIYLGAELLSGVLAGIVLAMVLSALFGMVIEAIPARRIRPLGLIGFATVAFVVFGAFHVDQNIGRAEVTYAKQAMTKVYSAEEWSAGAWEKIATRRIDLAGQPEEVFAVQWVGDLAQLQSILSTQGWKPLPVWRWHDSFNYLDNKAPLDKLPPRPLLHQGLKAKLTMVLADAAKPERRLVMRAYKAQAEIDTEGRIQPVNLVSITSETVRQRFHLYALPTTLKPEPNDNLMLMTALNAMQGVRVLAQSVNPAEPARVYLAKP